MTTESAEEGSNLSLLLPLKSVVNGWGALSMFFWIIIVAFIQAPPSGGSESVAGLPSGAYFAILAAASVLLAVGALLALLLFVKSGRPVSSTRRYGRWLGVASLLLVDTLVIFHAGNVFHGGLSVPVSVSVIAAAGVSAALFVKYGPLSWGWSAFGAGVAIAIAPWLSWGLIGSGPFVMTLLLVPLFSSPLLMVDLLLIWPPVTVQEG